MSRLLLALVMIGLASPAAARDDRLTVQAPVKCGNQIVPLPPDPEVIRQGGDTVDGATVIDAIPYITTGTTAGYSDDYDECCPYTFSNSPDVVYTFTPTEDVELTIDLCGSGYDTKHYVRDAEFQLIACNDDYYFDDECGVYVSFLLRVPMSAGLQYYIFIDGYGGDSGDYILSISEFVPCLLDCPPEGFREGEPDLVDDYEDDYNGGCNSFPAWPFQNLNFGPSYIDFCGVAGWYRVGYYPYRDTDWFTATVGETGFIEVTADAESETNIFELEVPPDCEASILQSVAVGACAPGSMIIDGVPGTTVFLWAGASSTHNPGEVGGNMYDYLLTLDGLEGTATRATNWSQVKELYR